VGVVRGAEMYLWEEAVRRGPMGLTRLELQQLAYTLPDGPRQIVMRIFETVEAQTVWIVEARKELVSETARVRDIGIVVQKAGLRSYTDKEGRVYVADKETR
jgi:hypothetical protein